MKKPLTVVMILALFVPASADVLSGIYATKDSEINSRSDLTVINYGLNTMAAAHKSGSKDLRSVIHFDPNAVDYLTPIAGTTINSAILRLQVNHTSGVEVGPLEVRRLTQWWNEGTGGAWVGVDWDSYDYSTPGSSGSQLPWPGGPGALADSVAENPTFMGGPAGYLEVGVFNDIDVTASLQAAANGDPFEGFLIKFVEEGTGDDWFGVWTKDSSETPAELIIDYGPPDTCAEVLAMGHSIQVDLNDDCYVNLADFAIFAAQWLDCIDPTDASCAKPWE